MIKTAEAVRKKEEVRFLDTIINYGVILKNIRGKGGLRRSEEVLTNGEK